MKANIPIPEVAIIGATRGMLGMGLGFLLADRIGREKRKKVALPLVLIGALSTIPLAMDVWKRAKHAA